MKRIIAILILAACAVSCSFLDEVRTTRISEAEAYSTPDHIESQIYGCYDGFYGSCMYMGKMNENLHTASGLLHWGKLRTSDSYLSGVKLAKFSTDNELQSCFAGHYNGIFRCNKLLEGLESSPVDKDFKLASEAEVRLLRAILYYSLVRMFGDVPLVLNTHSLSSPRTVWYKVYGQVLEDLDFAEKNMLDSEEQLLRTGDSNRPSKWAATAFKSSVYLTIASILSHPDDNFWNGEGSSRYPHFETFGIESPRVAWQLAYDCARKVIYEGPYELASRYDELFDWGNPATYKLKERIFTLQSTTTVSSNVQTALYSLPNYMEGTLSMTTDNANFGRVRPSRWLFWKWAETYGGTLTQSTVKDPIEGSETENATIDVTYYPDCKDPRIDATMYYDSYRAYSTTTKQVAPYRLYPYKSRLLDNYTKGTFPYLKKYYDPQFNNNAGNADFYFLRLGEIYLIAAEAAVELSSGDSDPKWAEALGYVEKLHARARISVPDGSPVSAFPNWNGRSFSGKEEFVDAIMWEREFELCGEGHEWFDTHRRGATYMLNHICIPLNAFLQSPEQGDYHVRNETTHVVTKNSGHWRYYYQGQLYPENVGELRRSLLCGFPRVEVSYNTEISAEDENDFKWN